MRKLQPVFALLLVGSISLNCFLIFRIANSQPGMPKLDQRLVGVWRSKNPHGIRLTLLADGGLIVTNYSTPCGSTGKWEVVNGKLQVHWWLADDYEPSLLPWPTAPTPRETTYSLHDKDSRLVFTDEVVLPNVREFVKLIGEP